MLAIGGAYAVLTKAGVAAMHKAWLVYAQGIATYFAYSLSTSEAQLITQSMTRMLDALG